MQHLTEFIDNNEEDPMNWHDKLSVIAGNNTSSSPSHATNPKAADGDLSFFNSSLLLTYPTLIPGRKDHVISAKSYGLSLRLHRTLNSKYKIA
jgi:hypothetical protein